MAAGLSRPGVETAAMCAKLEMELAQMDQEEEQEFRQSLDAGEDGAARMIRLSYDLLGLVSFFTTVSNEVKAWTVPKNTLAAQAAERIHSDMERGFIRAEVVAYDDLMRCGGIAETRRQGLLRSEGRTRTAMSSHSCSTCRLPYLAHPEHLALSHLTQPCYPFPAARLGPFIGSPPRIVILSPDVSGRRMGSSG